MENSLNERIKILIHHYSKSVNAFSKEYNIPQRTLAECVKEGRDPRHSLLLRLLSISPEINVNWLIKGEGEMIKKKPSLSPYEIPELASFITDADNSYGNNSATTIERLMELINDLKEENKTLREDNNRKNKIIDGLLKEK